MILRNTLSIIAFSLVILSIGCGADDESADVSSPATAQASTAAPTSSPFPPTPTPIPEPTAEPPVMPAPSATPPPAPTGTPSLEPIATNTPVVHQPGHTPTSDANHVHDAAASATMASTATAVPPAEIIDIPIGLPGADSYIYWLSDVDLNAIAEARPSVTVIDYSFDGTDETAFSASEIDSLRSAMTAPAKVIAYMSIGEAEDYRYYWQEDWTPGSPEWLVQENPNWEGNFKVQFWDTGWQATIFGQPESYLDRILAAGFDGVYMDIIDAYEFFEERGVSDSRQRMIDFVTDLSRYAKSKNPDFLIVPQNAPELGEDPAYLDVVDGIGMESVYYGYEFKNVLTDPTITLELEEALFRFTAAGKFVLTTDYAVSSLRVQDAYKRSRANGFLPTVTEVDLAGLPVHETFR